MSNIDFPPEVRVALSRIITGENNTNKFFTVSTLCRKALKHARAKMSTTQAEGDPAAITMATAKLVGIFRMSAIAHQKTADVMSMCIDDVEAAIVALNTDIANNSASVNESKKMIVRLGKSLTVLTDTVEALTTASKRCRSAIASMRNDI